MFAAAEEFLRLRKGGRGARKDGFCWRCGQEWTDGGRGGWAGKQAAEGRFLVFSGIGAERFLQLPAPPHLY